MKSPRRFCMVTTFYPPYHFGGDAMHVYRLTNELARRGHEVTVLHSVDAYRALGNSDPQRQFAHEDGVTVHRLSTRTPRLTPLVSYLSGRPALQSPTIDAVLDREFDVVHFHNVSLMGGPGILERGRGAKLYTMHEHWLVCPMHVLWKYNREPCYERDCLRCTFAFHRPPQLWRYGGLLDRAVKNVDLFLSPSRFTLQAHRDRGFDLPIRHLPYFLPSSFGKPPEPSPKADRARPYFLYVGRLEKLKGVQRLIERFRDYEPADLLVAGDGDYAGELHRQAADLPNVHFLGRVDQHELPALYAGAIALIVPSIGFEVFGIVMLEAFAQRTPVIVNDLGALPEVVTESGGGLIYRTQQELLDGMESLRDNVQRRRELGERGHAAWLAKWSEDTHIARYLQAIDELPERRTS
jgi:glycosyltransferase involved in cell wall biosynthesis